MCPFIFFCKSLVQFLYEFIGKAVQQLHKSIHCPYRSNGAPCKCLWEQQIKNRHEGEFINLTLRWTCSSARFSTGTQPRRIYLIRHGKKKKCSDIHQIRHTQPWTWNTTNCVNSRTTCHRVHLFRRQRCELGSLKMGRSPLRYLVERVEWEWRGVFFVCLFAFLLTKWVV